MASSRIDLLNHEFTRSFRGYSTKEVDLFIHELADSIARMSEEKVMQSKKLATLEAKISEYDQRENNLRQTLVATQRMMEDIKNSAQREAQLIIESARGKAENLASQGSLRLARIMDEISDAHRIKAQFEFQVRSVIERHLKLLQMSREEEEELLNQVASLGVKPVGAQGTSHVNAVASAILQKGAAERGLREATNSPDNIIQNKLQDKNITSYDNTLEKAEEPAQTVPKGVGPSSGLPKVDKLDMPSGTAKKQ